MKINLNQTLLGALTLLLLLNCNLVQGKERSVDLTKSSIYVDAKANSIKQFAAKELQKHLKLITNVKIPIIHDKKSLNYNSFTFMVGVLPNSKRTVKLATEEAGYRLDKKLARLYLFGDDFIESSYATPRATCAYSRNRVGTLFAVYDFLNHELGVKWIKPGDAGIIYSEQHRLIMSRQSYRWVPNMLFRGWRTEAWDQRIQRRFNSTTPVAVKISAKELAAKCIEELIWQRRMKFGEPNRPGYGHAFTKYWAKYGEKHPEWFALGKNRQRGVLAGQKADRLKLCVSNPELLDAIVAEWQAKWLKNKNYNVYNACPNDSRGYCRCKKCCALDVSKDSDKHYAGIDGIDNEGILKKQAKGDTFETDPKSDRYVYFWNELLKRARKFNPKAKLIVYIYSDYRYAPRRQILADGIICGFVPRFRDLPATTGKTWAQWEKMGMKEVFLRPNDFNDSVGMPMGNSKYIYDKFTLSKKYRLVGTDYDRAYNGLDAELNGLAFYVLGQAFNYPDKSYATLADEFYSTFGKAKADIRAYYRYWVKLFEQKRLAKVQAAGGFEGRRYMFNNLANFYQTEDFVKGQQILQRALQHDISTRVRKNIRSIVLATEHAKLLYLAITRTTIEEKMEAAQVLYKFRVKNRQQLSASLTLMFGVEASFNDISGIQAYVINATQGMKKRVLIGKNMVKNGNFNQGDKNWYIPKKDQQLFNLFPALADENSYLKVIGAKKLDDYSRISNLIKGVALKVGDEVIIKARIRSDKLTGTFEVMLRQVDNKNRSLLYRGFSFSKSAAFDWKNYSKKIKIRAGATKFYIYIIARNLANDDAVYVTNISMGKIE